MAIEGALRITLTGDRAVRRKLKVVAGDFDKAEKSKVQSAKRTKTDLERLAKKSAADDRRANQRRVREWKNAERERLRASKRRASEELKLQKKAEREESASLRRRQQKRRSILGAVAGGAAGAAYAGMEYARRSQGVLGVQTKEQITARSLQTRRDLLLAGSDAGMSKAEIEKMMKDASAVAKKRGVSVNDLLAGALKAQEDHSDIKGYASRMDINALAMRTTGASAAELVGVEGNLKDILGLQGEEIKKGLLMAIQSGTEGAINLRDFATEMPEGFGLHAAAFGETGLDALRSSMAMSQQIKKGTGVKAAEVQTMQKALTMALADKDVQKRFKKAGLDVVEWDGSVLGIAELVEAASGNAKLGDIGTLKKIMGTDEGAIAMQALLGQERAAGRGDEGAMSLAARQKIDSDAAMGLLEKKEKTLDADIVGKAQRTTATQESKIFDQTERLTQAMLDTSGWLTELEAEFPILTDAVKGLTSVVAGVFGGGFLSGLFGGGATATAGGGAAAAGGGGLLATIGAIAAPVTAAVGAGVLWNEGEKHGKKADDLEAGVAGKQAERFGLATRRMKGGLHVDKEMMTRAKRAAEAEESGMLKRALAQAGNDRGQRELIESMRQLAAAYRERQRNVDVTAGPNRGAS